MRRCDLCNEESERLSRIADEFRGEGLSDICERCNKAVTDSMYATVHLMFEGEWVAVPGLNKLKARVRQSIWKRCVEAIRGKKP